MSTRRISITGNMLLEVALLIAFIATTTAAMLAWLGGASENVADIEHVTGMEELAQNIRRQVRDVGTVSQITAANLVATGMVPVRLRTPSAAQPIKGPRGGTIQPQQVSLYSATDIDTLLFSFQLGPTSPGVQMRLCQAYAEMGQRAYDIVRIGSETLKEPGLALRGADRIAAAANAHCGTGGTVVIQLGIVAG